MTCPLCSIFLGNDPMNQKVEIDDDDCVKLFPFTRERWPRDGSSARHGVPLAGLEVKIGPKGKNAISSVKHVPIWTDNGEFGEMSLPDLLPGMADRAHQTVPMKSGSS